MSHWEQQRVKYQFRNFLIKSYWHKHFSISIRCWLMRAFLICLTSAVSHLLINSSSEHLKISWYEKFRLHLSLRGIIECQLTPTSSQTDDDTLHIYCRKRKKAEMKSLTVCHWHGGMTAVKQNKDKTGAKQWQWQKREMWRRGENFWDEENAKLSVAADKVEWRRSGWDDDEENPERKCWKWIDRSQLANRIELMPKKQKREELWDEKGERKNKWGKKWLNSDFRISLVFFSVAMEISADLCHHSTQQQQARALQSQMCVHCTGLAASVNIFSPLPLLPLTIRNKFTFMPACANIISVE